MRLWPALDPQHATEGPGAKSVGSDATLSPLEAIAKSPADRAFRLGFVGNLGLAAVKLLVGWVAGSRALVADGWHSISDVAVNVGTWLAHRFARRAPDEDHHYGHGKAEALAGFVVGFLLVLGGAGVAWGSWTVKGVTLHAGWRGAAALAVAALAIVVKAVLAWITRGIEAESKSHGLRALARDHGSDALSGVLVLGGILATRNGIAWAEPAAAVVIGGLIVLLGWRSASEGFDVLMDRVSDPRVRERLESTAQGVIGVRGVQSVRVHPVGNGLRVDMEISVDGQQTVEQGHTIAHAVERAVTKELPSVKEVHVHVNPWSQPAAGSD